MDGEVFHRISEAQYLGGTMEIMLEAHYPFDLQDLEIHRIMNMTFTLIILGGGVNPGGFVNRGSHRILIDNNGNPALARAYYCPDHYKTFIRLH